MAGVVRALAAASSSSSSSGTGEAEVGVEAWEALLPEFSVGSVTPLEDFSALLAALQLSPRPRAQQLQDAALVTMAKIADRNVLIGASRSHYKRALSCLQALREASVRLDRPAAFNAYLRSPVQTQYHAGRHAAFFQLLQQEDVSLIARSEAASSEVTADEQRRFLSENAAPEPEAAPSAEDVADDADDLFGDMA
jgi:ATP-dependent DNA helicase 2 subunit 2